MQTALQTARSDLPDERIQQLDEWIRQYAHRHRLDPVLIVAIISAETDVRNIIGSHGEGGYMQLRPSTFRSVCGYETTAERLVYDVEENVRCGVKYLAQLRDRWGLFDALSRYNGGAENWQYVLRVLQRYQWLKEAS